MAELFPRPAPALLAVAALPPGCAPAEAGTVGLGSLGSPSSSRTWDWVTDVSLGAG